MRHEVGRAGDAPHQDREVREASTESDPLRKGTAVACSQHACDPDRTGAQVVLDEPADPAGQKQCQVARPWMGGDGAALLSIATPMARGTIKGAAGAERSPACGFGRPGDPAHRTPAEQAAIASRVSGSSPVDEGACAGDGLPSPPDHEQPRRGWDRQAQRRWNEREFRKRSVEFCRAARLQAGQSARRPPCSIYPRARCGAGVKVGRRIGCRRAHRGGRRALPRPSVKQRSRPFWESMVPASASRRSGPRTPTWLRLNYPSCARSIARTGAGRTPRCNAG